MTSAQGIEKDISKLLMLESDVAAPVPGPSVEVEEGEDPALADDGACLLLRPRVPGHADGGDRGAADASPSAAL